MNRRDFLKAIGAFAAASQLPALYAKEQVCWPVYHDPEKRSVYFRCRPLTPADKSVNFNQVKRGVGIYGISPVGGETLIGLNCEEGEEITSCWLGGITVDLADMTGRRGTKLVTAP